MKIFPFYKLIVLGALLSLSIAANAGQYNILLPLGSLSSSAPAETYTAAYSTWGACQPGDTQTRTVSCTQDSDSAVVANSFCDPLDPLVQACTYTPPPSAPIATSGYGEVNIIEVYFDSPIDASNLNSAYFSVTINGVPTSIMGISPQTSQIDLFVSNSFSPNQVVTVTYTDPTAGDDSDVIEGLTGSDVASFTFVDIPTIWW